MRVKIILLAALAIFLTAGAWLALESAGRERPFNLILISIDTLRADRLGCYGYNRPTTPAIDDLAEKSTVFKRVASVSSWTLPSHVTMLSGLYPSTHGVVRSKGRKIAAHTPLLAEILKNSGYRTFSYNGGIYVGKSFGFSRGFDEYRSYKPHRAEPDRGFGASLTKARETISSLNSEERFFLFLHTYDAHCPYNPPEPYFSLFQSPDSEAVQTERCCDSRQHLTPGQIKYLSDRYDGGIRWVDERLKDFFEFLNQTGRMNDTMVVVTSDHGEEFGEHGGVGHQKTLYRESLMIPLIIYVPGRTGRQIDEQVGLIDLFPTLLDLLGIESDARGQGTSLAALIDGSTLASKVSREFQYSELDRGLKLRSALTEDQHYLLDLKTKQPLLFDHREDPLEQRNKASDAADLADVWRQRLTVFMNSLERGQGEKMDKLPKEEINKLKTLGYM